MKRLAPDFKTIADFRKDNPKGLRAASRQFVLFCQQARLLTHRLVAIDGSKFRAAASTDRCLNRNQLQEQQPRIDRKIALYLEQLDQSDRNDAALELDRDGVQAALNRLWARQAELNVVATALVAKGGNQYCSTEPDARRMRSGREGMVVGYNIQSAVDVVSGLIIHHEVTDQGADNRQLDPVAKQVKQQAGVEVLPVVADAGYSNGEQLNDCDEAGIQAAVPANRAINNQGDHYQKQDFSYDPERDCYTCPAGQRLHYTTRMTRQKQWLYSRTGCRSCPLQPRCTKADKRWVTRHFYEAAFARSKARLAESPGLMFERMAAVGRPFGVIKHLLGMRRFHAGVWKRLAPKWRLGCSAITLNT